MIPLHDIIAIPDKMMWIAIALVRLYPDLIWKLDGGTFLYKIAPRSGNWNRLLSLDAYAADGRRLDTPERRARAMENYRP